MTDASASQSTATGAQCVATIVVGRMEFRVYDRMSLNAARWLQARGLEPEVPMHYVTVTATVGRGAGRAEWLAMPTVAVGKVVGWQFRRLEDGEPRFLSSGSVAKHVWNADVLDDATLAGQPLIITEGRCDAWAAIQSGFPRTISIPGGAPEKEIRSDSALPWLAEIEPKLKAVKRIVIATDGDVPGVVMQNEIAKRLGRGRCAYVDWPEGVKDFNELLVGWGERAIVDAVNTSRWLHVPGIYLPSELPPRPATQQHVSGFPGLDDKYRVRRQDFAVWTGWPGSGKTTVANDFWCRMAEAHGWRTAFASFEQPPQTQQMWALRQWVLGICPEDMSKPEIERADRWINEHFRFVIPDEDRANDLDWMFDMMGTGIVRYGVDAVVIDPWNEIEHKRDSGQTLTEYIGASIRDLKRFARKWDIHLCVLAHPAKPKGHKDGEPLPEPTLDMISDSQNWYNKADVGLVVHPKVRDDGAGYTKLRIAKSKYHRDIGKPGVVNLSLNTRTNRYSEIYV